MMWQFGRVLCLGRGSSGPALDYKLYSVYYTHMYIVRRQLNKMDYHIYNTCICSQKTTTLNVMESTVHVVLQSKAIYQVYEITTSSTHVRRQQNQMQWNYMQAFHLRYTHKIGKVINNENKVKEQS